MGVSDFLHYWSGNEWKWLVSEEIVSYFLHCMFLSLISYTGGGYVEVLAWSDVCYFYGMKWIKVTTDLPVLCMGDNWEGLSYHCLPYTCNTVIWFLPLDLVSWGLQIETCGVKQNREELYIPFAKNIYWNLNNTWYSYRWSDDRWPTGQPRALGSIGINLCAQEALFSEYIQHFSFPFFH